MRCPMNGAQCVLARFRAVHYEQWPNVADACTWEPTSLPELARRFEVEGKQFQWQMQNFGCCLWFDWQTAPLHPHRNQPNGRRGLAYCNLLHVHPSAYWPSEGVAFCNAEIIEAAQPFARVNVGARCVAL